MLRNNAAGQLLCNGLLMTLGNCIAISNHLTVAVYQANPVVMTVSGDTLHAYGAYQFQWHFFNNSMLTGETGSILALQPKTDSTM